MSDIISGKYTMAFEQAVDFVAITLQIMYNKYHEGTFKGIEYARKKKFFFSFGLLQLFWGVGLKVSSRTFPLRTRATRKLRETTFRNNT